MYITGLGTAAPVHCYRQAECWDALQRAPQFERLDKRARATLQRVLLRNNGIRTRHLAFTALSQAFDLDPDTLHQRFAQHAPALASQAAADALADAGVGARDIDAVIVSTCTGYLCPGLTSWVTERLDLRSDVIALDLVGQGCGAALPNMRSAAALLHSATCKHVLSVCVEVCSAAFYLDNDPGVLISACLFGDGAGAAVLSAEPNAHRRKVEWSSACSLLNPAQRDVLRFEQRGGMLRNILTPQVPALAAEHAAIVLEQALHDAGLQRRDIAGWIWHPGGSKVIDALQQTLGLNAEDVRHSREVLSEFGNVSSSSVYFVMRAALRSGAPRGWWWMSSFGAGFTCHGALLRIA